MNYREGSETVSVVWLTGVYLLGASWFDMRSLKIPNWWSLSAVVAILLSMGIGVSWKQMFWVMIQMMSVVVLCFPLFLVRVIGAGDVKMMACLVGSLGYRTGLRVIGTALVIAAIWGLGKLLWMRSFRRRLMILAEYLRQWRRTGYPAVYYQAERDGREGVIPLAVCLLLGFLNYSLV